MSYQLVNSGAAYADGNPFAAGDLNSLISNAEEAWSLSVSQMTQPIKPADGSPISRPVYNAITGQLHVHAYSLPIILSAQCLISATGNATLAASTGGPSAPTVACRDQYNSRWRVFSRNSTTSLYSSAGDDLLALSATTSANAHTTTDAVYSAAPGSYPGYVIACGSASASGAVATYNGTTQSGFALNANGTGFDGIATDMDNAGARVVAVGNGCCSYSTNYGAAWTHATLPALPGLAVGGLSLCYSVALGLFICSGLLSSGHLFWSTSTTGASWQAWRRTNSLAMDASITTASPYPTLGIAAVGSVLVAPHVTGTTTPQIGIMVSFDAGASWLTIPGGAKFNSTGLSYLRAIKFGKRVAISSLDSLSITGPIVAYDRVNSVAV